MISHAGARALWDTPRLKWDQVLEVMAAKGGILGIEAAPHTTLTEQHPRHSIESCMQHFEYALRLIGIEHVGFGPDNMFGNHEGLHRAYAKQLSVDKILGSSSFEAVEHVDGLENPADFPNIVRWRVIQDYADADIAKVIAGNARILQQVRVC